MSASPFSPEEIDRLRSANAKRNVIGASSLHDFRTTFDPDTVKRLLDVAADYGRLRDALERVATKAQRCIDLLSFNYGGAPTLAATNPQLAARDELKKALAALAPSASVPEPQLPPEMERLLADPSVVLPGEERAWRKVYDWVIAHAPEDVHIYTDVPKGTVDLPLHPAASVSEPAASDEEPPCTSTARAADNASPAGSSAEAADASTSEGTQ